MDAALAARPSAPPALAARPPRAGRALIAAACALAGALTLSLAWRPLASVDLGYHLAYGEVLLNHGRIVSDATFVQTFEPPLPDDRPPGVWFDADGRYRFPNANWLTQAIVAIAARLGGWTALHLLQVVLVAALMAAQAGALRRMGLSWAWVGPVWLATAAGSYERMTLRPENLAYVCLAAQLWLLAGRITWARVAGFLAVQVLAANVHSYWMLGAGLAFAYALDAGGRAAWQRWRQASPRPLDPELRRRLVRLAVLAALALPAAMANPFGWRNLALPFQTLLYLRAHGISGETSQTLFQPGRTGIHPWTMIGEVGSPFQSTLAMTVTTFAAIGLLVLALPALAVLLWRRRWAETMILGAFLGVSLSMRRNLALGAILGWPMVALAAKLAIDALRQRSTAPAPPAPARRRDRRRTPAPAPAAAPAPPAALGRPALAGLAGVAIVSLVGTLLVVTNTFYRWERREARFGGEVMPLWIPEGPCRWLDEHLDAPRPIFTDINASSSVAYLCRTASAVPLLTNTWACPPSRMGHVFVLCTGGGDFDAATRDWGMDVALFQTWPFSKGLAQRLIDSPSWALVHMEGWYVVFVRRTPAFAELIARCEIRRETFDVQAFIGECRRLDRRPAMGLKAGAGSLQTFGWLDPAIDAWRACLQAEPGQGEAWQNLGTCLANRGNQRLAANDGAGLDDLREAQRCFTRALELRSSDQAARQNLQRVEAQLRQAEMLGL